MIQVGTVTGSEIAYNRDRKIKSLMLQVKLTSDKDIQTVEYFGGFGDDSIPPTGSTVMVVSIGQAWKIAIASRADIEPVAGSTGDKVIRGTNSDGTSEAGRIILKQNGDIEITPGSGTLYLNGNLQMTGTIDGDVVFNGQNSLVHQHSPGTYNVSGAPGPVAGCSGGPGC